ncbi:MAG TPA: TIM barrel protein, partial [Armatimonadota bacterium]|nr:TIM barrel protein [Armatimonadota bacterium]
DSGENPVAAAEKYADRLYGVHVKDFIFGRNGAPEDVIVGTGNLDLPQLFATLTSNGFSGYLTLEYEGDEKNPVPSVRECVEKLGQLG